MRTAKSFVGAPGRSKQVELDHGSPGQALRCEWPGNELPGQLQLSAWPGLPWSSSTCLERPGGRSRHPPGS